MNVKENLKPIIFKLTRAIAVLLVLWLHNGHAVVEITPRISAGVEYTDNVRLVPDNTESDYITTVTPGITLDIPADPPASRWTMTPSYVTMPTTPTKTTGVMLANLDGWWQSGRHTRFELTNAFLKTEDPISNDDLTVRQSRNPYTRNTANISFEQQFGAENVATLAFEHSILENEDPTIDDSQRYVPSFELTYWLNVRWGLDLSADLHPGGVRCPGAGSAR